jgi:RNA polymerase sigma factor (sigma-70 family)
MAGAPASLLRHVHQLIANHTIGQLTDRQLLERFAAQRDEAAFALLVRRHGPMVLGLCRRLLGHEQDAEDAFQAVFLILARKAGSIRQADVGGFLYRVAYHLAVRARGEAVKRKQRDKRGGVMSRADPMTDADGRDVRAVVDEELQRLPDELRSALVLYYLEGKTHEEAARLLNWSKRTLGRRLERGRELLRSRLLARGLTPMAALTASLFAEGGVSAAVPATLATATVRTVLASKAAPAIAALAEAGLSILSVSKAKAATLILLAASLLGGAGLWACLDAASPRAAAPAEPPAAKASDKPKTTPPQRGAVKTVEIQGRVLGPNGKPKAGAKLLLLGEDKIVELGVSAADGRFTVMVPKEAKSRRLIARTDDAGIDFLYAGNLKPGKPVELRLVKDRPIRGRIVTTEGKPVAGARVAVRNLRVYADNSLESFLIAWEKRRGNSEMPDGVKGLWPEGVVPFAATTGADGRFVVRGVGSERVVLLRISGPGITSTELWVVNRDGFDPKPYNQELRNHSPGRVLYGPWTMISGPDLSIVAESEKIIRGVVKDADTGKGQPGVKVWLLSSGDDDKLFGGLLALPLETRTDAEGRYEIHGARKMKSYVLQVLKNPTTGYLGNHVRIEDTLGYQPITADVLVKKGVIVTGKVIDQSTGKPVPGYVRTAVLNGNPFAKGYSIDNKYPHMVEHAETGKDGTFRDVVIPGPVLLMGNVDLTRLSGGEAESLGYKQCVPDPKYPKYFQTRSNGTLSYFGLDGVPGAFGGNSCKVLDAKPGTTVVHQDLFVERESVQTVKIQDAEGRPLAGVWATGLRPERNGPVRIKSDSCPAYALESGKPRLMVFYERGRKLAGVLTLNGDEKEPTVAKLGPTGAIRGRLLDADGKPLAGFAVNVRYRDRQAEAIHKFVHEAKQAVTYATGAFTLDELIPELKFELSFHHGRRRFERQTKPVEATIQVKPGERREMGAITLKLVPKKMEE